MSMLRDELKFYEDENGVLTNAQKVIDGNALLYTGALAVLLHRLDDYRTTDFDVYDLLLNRTEIKPGLLQRYGKPGDWQAHDDYVGMVTASYFIDHGAFAERVLKQGWGNWFCWNNQNPGKFTLDGFFVRFAGWWAMVKASSDHWLNPIDQVASFIDLVGAGLYENGSSGTLMTYLRYNVFVQKSVITHPLTRLGCWIYRKLYMRRHPKGIKESYAEYFGPMYPLALLEDGFF
jgi:hypothetical protein